MIRNTSKELSGGLDSGLTVSNDGGNQLGGNVLRLVGSFLTGAYRQSRSVLSFGVKGPEGDAIDGEFGANQSAIWAVPTATGFGAKLRIAVRSAQTGWNNLVSDDPFHGLREMIEFDGETGVTKIDTGSGVGSAGGLVVHSDSSVAAMEFKTSSRSLMQYVDGNGWRFKDLDNDRVAVMIDSTSTNVAVRPVFGVNSQLGLASRPWSSLYVQNSPNVVSDERLKKFRGGLTEPEFNAGLAMIKEIGFYQWIKDVDEDAKSAALVAGVRAQKIIDCFKANKLDWKKYDIVKHEAWESEEEDVLEAEYLVLDTDTPEVVELLKRAESDCDDCQKKERAALAMVKGPEGQDIERPKRMVAKGKKKTVLEAGDRYTVNIDALQFFMMAVTNQRLDALAN